jgi:sulfur-oxidizing protein SoxZ
MTTLTKVTARANGEHTEVLVLVRHPMATGHHADAVSGNRIAAHYIETMTFRLNGHVVAEAYPGPGVASNPVTSILIPRTRPGDQVKVEWTDNQGQRGNGETVVE